jgi:tetratricopeptide (TPR) repeat protein
MAVSSSFLPKISSSFAEFAEPPTAVGHGLLCQRLIALGLLRATNSKQLFHQLATNLIRIAEHSIGLRDMQTLSEVSEILSNIPLPEAMQAGTYYCALVMKRRGQADEAHTLLEMIADSQTASYRARAMQTLGVMHHEQRNLDDAGRFYIEAMRTGTENDLITALSARETISAIKSTSDDHQGALCDLENLWPLFRLVAKQYPFYFYVYHADLAYELGEVGRVAEAEAACAIALASPFAPAYPEWSETRDEIAAKRVSATPSVVTINRAPEAAPSPRAVPKRKPKPIGRLAISWPACKKTFLQRASNTIAVTSAIPLDGITQSILDRMLICIGPRAPPAHS